MPNDVIKTSIDGDIATVLIDREDKRNCLSLPMWVALGEALSAASAMVASGNFFDDPPQRVSGSPATATSPRSNGRTLSGSARTP